MAWPNPSYYLASKAKRPNLYYLATSVTLCSIFYIAGIWQHTRGGVANLAESECTQLQNISGVAPKSHTLDFDTHHSAIDLPIAPTSPARVNHFPACPTYLSEYTPCEDAQRSLKFDRVMLVYRERHCPEPNEVLKCRVPAPNGYTTPFRWPESRDSVWFANVPHKELTVEKAVQNWVRFEGKRFRFPGGGTMFPRGADAYIDEIGKLINLKDGSIRTAIDTGCGVASWGAYLLSRNILTVSFAPRDTHEAQVQFALERGVPALIGVMASIRLPYPSRAFDMAHCSRCLIPWGQYGGLYLIEIDRILRPGGYWILSGPPVNWKKHWKGWNRTAEDLNNEQSGIEAVAKSLCWKKLVEKDDLAVWQKPTNHAHCQINRKVYKKPPFCEGKDPDQAWYTKLENCLTPLPEVGHVKDIAGGMLKKWPERLTSVPPRIMRGSVKGITAKIFREDTDKWKKRVTYYKGFDGNLAVPGRFRNILDMNAYLGGFAAALINDPLWVMNMVPVEAEINTLGIIYERGLIGTYQNWCEAMSTYPRTYDFIHGDSVFTLYKDRCEMENILLEMDRILRPGGTVILRDDVDMVVKIQSIIERLNWNSKIVDHEEGPHHTEKIVWAVKQYWTAPAAATDQQGSKTS
ncbi:hypothetical protein VitviT2T_023602 [Vitis vinifera]|uniref:Methyltransferase n=3 Tax=Vitis vinifera TaxID=29760 RepID=A0ABY9DD98_VITVI|eukprot:XP_002269747.2 PREDICTED: probable methyltransferase PMT15 [Vitis vinifera]